MKSFEYSTPIPVSLAGLTAVGLILLSAVSAAVGAPGPARSVSRGKISAVTYEGHKAYRLTDGVTEAVVVPSVGRVMRFGLVGGPNFLFDHLANPPDLGGWTNYGGDKTWLAPQSDWVLTIGHGFPPDPAWDNSPFRAETLPDGHLRITSPNSRAFGARLTRDFSYDAAGNFVITQTVSKTSGYPMRLSIWSITQVEKADAIFLPLDPGSAYKNNYYWISKSDPAAGITAPLPTLLEVRPGQTSNYKIGVDGPAAGIAAVKGGWVFVERASKPEGSYPDGPDRNGFAVELYNSADPVHPYNELEMLGPLAVFKPGDVRTRTVRWSLSRLPTGAPEAAAAIDQLLHRAVLP